MNSYTQQQSSMLNTSSPNKSSSNPNAQQQASASSLNPSSPSSANSSFNFESKFNSLINSFSSGASITPSAPVPAASMHANPTPTPTTTSTSTNHAPTMITSLASTSNSTKTTSIKLPGVKKPKTIGGGKKPDIKADVDVAKFIHKNKEEANPILDLSKNNVTILPASLKEVFFLIQLNFYFN